MGKGRNRETFLSIASSSASFNYSVNLRNMIDTLKPLMDLLQDIQKEGDYVLGPRQVRSAGMLTLLEDYGKRNDLVDRNRYASGQLQPV